MAGASRRCWRGRLDPELLRRPDATLSFAQAAALLDHSAEMLDLSDIGLRLARYRIFRSWVRLRLSSATPPTCAKRLTASRVICPIICPARG